MRSFWLHADEEISGRCTKNADGDIQSDRYSRKPVVFGVGIKFGAAFPVPSFRSSFSIFHTTYEVRKKRDEEESRGICVVRSSLSATAVGVLNNG